MCTGSTRFAPRSATSGGLDRGVVYGAVVWIEHSLGRGWTLGEHLARSDWSGNEIAATVLTDALHVVCTGGAIRALERAYAGLGRLWWQVDIATFAVWLEGEH